MFKPRIVVLDAGTMGDDIQWPDFGALGELVLHEHTSPHDVPTRIHDAEILLTNKVVITAEHIAAAPKLRYIGTLATGYNQVDGAAAATRNIPLCNVPGYSTTAVMQHTFALLLSLSSRICQLDASVKAGDWEKSRHFCYWKDPLIELSGKTMGIVGYGDTGQAVAKMAHNFGMDVLAYAPNPKEKPEYAPFAFTDIATLFQKADVVSLHCPLTSENEGFINATLLRTMKKSAFLINCSRGPLINETDLAAALHKGIIGGAGLDVVAEEPMRVGNPLLSAPNCLITPHAAWSTVEARKRLLQSVYDNVKNFLAGTPTNVRCLVPQ